VWLESGLHHCVTMSLCPLSLTCNLGLNSYAELFTYELFTCSLIEHLLNDWTHILCFLEILGTSLRLSAWWKRKGGLVAGDSQEYGNYSVGQRKAWKSFKQRAVRSEEFSTARAMG
jgi:hypothetical protein